MEIKESLKKYLSPLLSFPSKLIDIFSMPHALNFYQLQFNDDLIDNAIVAETNALRVLRPAQFFHAGGKGFSARSSTVSTIRPSALAGNLRKSLGSSIFFVGKIAQCPMCLSGRQTPRAGRTRSPEADFFHSMRKGTAFQPFLELGVRNCLFPAPFRNDGQIVQVFQQLFIIANVQNNGGFPPVFIGQKLNCPAHV